MKQVRVNVRTRVNAASIRREKRNGREKIIVPSATLPDNVVMNDISYPADEIAKSFASLNGTVAPLGHPHIDGKFISATSDDGLAMAYIGATNANARQEGGRVLLDKVIDVDRANESPGGRAVLAAIEKGDPVHTSTGLLCELVAANGDVPYKHIARNIIFDHDAILLNEEGAATPAQGVGMMVNAAGEETEIQVINSTLADQADEEVNWALQSLAQAMDKRDPAPVLERMKAAIREALGLSRDNAPANDERNADMTDKVQYDALKATVDTLVEAQSKMGETIANAVTAAMKPLTDNLAEMQANEKAKNEAELAGYVATIVKANVLDEASAKELTLNAARKLAEKAKPGTAAALNGATGKDGEKDEFADLDLNAGLEASK